MLDNALIASMHQRRNKVPSQNSCVFSSPPDSCIVVNTETIIQIIPRCVEVVDRDRGPIFKQIKVQPKCQALGTLHH